MLVKNEMSFEDLKRECWSGAINTLQKIEELGLEDDFMILLESVFEVGLDLDGKIPTMTELNDFLWFEDDYIMECLGVNEDDEE